MDDIFFRLWPILSFMSAGMLTVVIWFARLGSRVDALTKVVEAMEKDHNDLKSKMYEQLSVIKETLARLEGFLQANKNK